MTAHCFTDTVGAVRRDHAVAPVPCDLDEIWGVKPRHRITGTVNNVRICGVFETSGTNRRIILTPVWRRDNGLAPGDLIEVVLPAEGPERADLAAAPDATPVAAAFFDSLP